MPELPEVETVRRGLERAMRGRRVVSAALHRADVWVSESGAPFKPSDLLAGDVIQTIDRRGKQLAIIGARGRIVVIHLGMSGQVLALRGAESPRQASHIHAEWRLDDGARVLFRDPRRFGGLWTLSSSDALTERWSHLGPDALHVSGRSLQERSEASARAIKAVLLDQAVLAGVGNIYADEALFRAGISPRRKARRLRPEEWDRLAAAIRTTLAGAVEARGSTLRDYRSPAGEAGGAQRLHQVYGRGGKPCLTCGKPLRRMRLSQRTTVYCPRCQR